MKSFTAVLSCKIDRAVTLAARVADAEAEAEARTAEETGRAEEAATAEVVLEVEEDWLPVVPIA